MLAWLPTRVSLVLHPSYLTSSLSCLDISNLLPDTKLLSHNPVSQLPNLQLVPSLTSSHIGSLIPRTSPTYLKCWDIINTSLLCLTSCANRSTLRFVKEKDTKFQNHMIDSHEESRSPQFELCPSQMVLHSPFSPGHPNIFQLTGLKVF